MSLKKLFSFNFKHILPIGFSLIIILMVLTSLTAIVQLNQSSEIMNESAKKQSEKDALLETMEQDALKWTITQFEMLLTDDPFVVDELYMTLNELATSFTVSREEFKKKEIDQQMKILLEKQGVLARLNAPKQNKVYEYIQQDQKGKALTLFTEKTLPNSKLFFDIIKDMTEHESVRFQKIFQQTKVNNDKVLYSIILFDLICIVISILLTLFVINKQKENDKQLVQFANVDTLTKLPNRVNFINNINQQILEKPKSVFSLIFIDIDYFKSINDNYGHEVGDEILKRFSSKIQSTIKDVDILSRFGGDEFVLLLRSINSKAEAQDFAKKLSSELDTSFVINNNEIFTSSSIGATMYSEDARDCKSLLKNADFAMYSAKESGRNCFDFFSKETSDRMERDHSICHALHTTLKHNDADKQLFLMYQPLLNINDGEMTECEALLRWNSSEGNSISPDEFIPLAEKTNLIEKINLFVIDEVCKQQSEWQRIGITNIRININLSGNKIIFTNLLHHLVSNLKRRRLNPALFGIELTERTLIEISEDTINQLDICRQHGMSISIDDFGTGYSSLSYLKQLPITTLKIDKEFIGGLPEDNDDRAVVKAIITLGHSLNLDVVAEGVETVEQLDFLKNNACNTAQGFYFHKPLNSKEITHLKLVA